MSKKSSLNHLFRVHFFKERDIEWRKYLETIEPLNRFMTKHFSDNHNYYNQKFKLQSDYGFFNKLDFVINEFTQSDEFHKCTGFEKELIELQLRKKLQ